MDEEVIRKIEGIVLTLEKVGNNTESLQKALSSLRHLEYIEKQAVIAHQQLIRQIDEGLKKLGAHR